MPSFDQILLAKQAGKGWSAKAIAQFHYFNENGVCAKKRNTSDAAISEAVSSGLMKGGAIIAYGSLNLYHVEQIQEQATSRSPIRKARWNIDYHVRGVEEDILNAFEAIERAKTEQAQAVPA